MSEALLARFRIDDTTGRVSFEMPGQSPLELGWRGSLLGSRQNVEHALGSFRRKAGGLGPTFEALRDAIDGLDKDAYQLALVLADDSDRMLGEIRERLTSRWPHWRRPGDEVPVVEIVGRDHQFPFELLPLFDAEPVRNEFINYAEAEHALARFLGWGTAVRRVPPVPLETAPLQSHDGRVPLQFLMYATDGVAAEQHYFERCSDRLDVEGPWPTEVGDVNAARERVIDVLKDPALTLGQERRAGLPVQIRHFACHADTEAPDPQGYFLQLGGPGDAEIQVTLRDITDGWRARDAFEGPRPLMFMNACATSRLDPDTTRSFPNWALRTNHRGFIGTEIEVPDDVAAAFGEALYEAMLEGKPIAQALSLARRRLMSSKQTPLGLLYVHYGNPSIAIEVAR